MRGHAPQMVGVVLGMIVAGGPWLQAERRPVERLPKDLVRWSTVWVAIPQQMYAVDRDYGPFAALTWGPSKGAVMMVASTAKELWEAAKKEERPGRRPGEKEFKGVVVRYEF